MQLSRLGDMLEKEKAPHKLDRLASAQAKVAEQERVLAGRPLPGSLKHKPVREPSRPSSYPLDVWPLELAPIEPVPVPMPTPAESPAGCLAPAGPPG
jgi:hypothetical protein